MSIQPIEPPTQSEIEDTKKRLLRLLECSPAFDRAIQILLMADCFGGFDVELHDGRITSITPKPRFKPGVVK